MNCRARFESWLKSTKSGVNRALKPCVGWLPCVLQQHLVHPATGIPSNSSFFILSPRRRIRVVHIEHNKTPNTSGVKRLSDINSCQPNVESVPRSDTLVYEQVHSLTKRLSIVSTSSDSTVGEYWFTRWNRPLRVSNACSCSFRRSWRKSARDSKLHDLFIDNGESDHACQPEEPSSREKVIEEENDIFKRSKNFYEIECFVEGLLQGVMNEVFLQITFGETERHSVDQPLVELNICANSFKAGRQCKSLADTKKSSDYSTSTSTNQISHNSTDGLHLAGVHKSNVEDEISSTFAVGCINPSFLGTSVHPDSLENITVDIGQCVATCTASKKSEAINHHLLTKKKYDCTTSANKMKQAASLNRLQESLPKKCEVGESNFLAGGYPYNPPTVITPANNLKSISETKDFLHANNQTCNDAVFGSIGFHQPQGRDLLDPGSTPMIGNVQKRRKPCTHSKNFIRLKPLLFFLHGAGSSAELWTGSLHHFSLLGYEVVAPDMLGHGYSDAPDTVSAYDFNLLLKDALDIFDKFVTEHRKCVIIGHAYGSSLAAAIARYRYQHVVQLVLISGGGPTPLAPRMANSRPPSLPVCLQTCLAPLVVCGFRRNLLYAPCGKHIGPTDSANSAVPQYVLSNIAQGQDWPEGDATFHRRILVPTLLVHGMQDPYVTLVQECEMERTIPRSFLELIPGAGHYPMLDTPDQLNHMIQCFIDWWSQ